MNRYAMGLCVWCLTLGCYCGCTDKTNGGTVAGPTFVDQTNCPGSNPAAAPFTAPGGTGTENQPTATAATGARTGHKEARLAQSTTGAPTLGNTTITTTVDCGGNTDADGAAGPITVTRP